MIQTKLFADYFQIYVSAQTFFPCINKIE